jgi:hypothetical protein
MKLSPLKIYTLAGYALNEHVRLFFYSVPVGQISRSHGALGLKFIGEIQERSNIESFSLTF